MNGSTWVEDRSCLAGFSKSTDHCVISAAMQLIVLCYITYSPLQKPPIPLLALLGSSAVRMYLYSGPQSTGYMLLPQTTDLPSAAQGFVYRSTFVRRYTNYSPSKQTAHPLSSGSLSSVVRLRWYTSYARPQQPTHLSPGSIVAIDRFASHYPRRYLFTPLPS